MSVNSFQELTNNYQWIHPLMAKWLSERINCNDLIYPTWRMCSGFHTSSRPVRCLLCCLKAEQLCSIGMMSFVTATPLYTASIESDCYICEQLYVYKGNVKVLIWFSLCILDPYKEITKHAFGFSISNKAWNHITHHTVVLGGLDC